MYITVKATWVLFAVVVFGLAFCAWKYPRSVVPITIAIAAAAAMATIVEL
ncbi:hypothetical protein AB0H28_11880 [Micromonospora sp. NPDC050980]